MKFEQLEREAQDLMLASLNPPYLFQLGPEKGRLALDKAQAGPGPLPGLEADIEDLSLALGPKGQVAIRIVRPPNAKTPLPVILYVHGAGWVFGNAQTHDRLIRELALGTQAAVVFPSYSLSPEARFPVAIEEIYAVAGWITKQGSEFGLDAGRVAIAGDSVGGNMAAAVALMSKERGGPRFAQQLLFYPVTDAAFDTPSYLEFAEGYPLRRDAMQWFWGQYIDDPKQRLLPTASPLRASLEELKGLPSALVISAEADVLRDEGEAYANRLREAGVRVCCVRFQGMIHDFVMLNGLATTAAARGAIALAIQWLRQGLQGGAGL